MRRLGVFTIIFAILAIVATLYPPYDWGKDRITEWNNLTAGERRELFSDRPECIEVFPIKRYDFLFNSNQQIFYLSCTFKDQGNSTGVRYTLTRSINWQELLLEYALGCFIALIISFLFVRNRVVV